jgi:hypothetical protein
MACMLLACFYAEGSLSYDADDVLLTATPCVQFAYVQVSLRALPLYLQQPPLPAL